jgi:ribose 5-phosphate isomerase B
MSGTQILAIGSDHAGYNLKQTLIQELQPLGYEMLDFGCHSIQSVDYPDIIHPLARAINEGKIDRGIVICGSGIGVSIVANKYPNVRAALCHDEEASRLSRLHNDANVIALGARFMTEDKALTLVRVFLKTAFEGGRHSIRVNKISPVRE